MNVAHLKEKSRQIRKDIITSVALTGASHVGSALSCVDILTCLYFSILRINPNNPKDYLRDRLILSKGHAGIALLVTLAHRGFFLKSQLRGYCQNGSKLTGHTMAESAPGVEVTTGSLGHGLSMGIGMAIAAKRDRKNYRTFVVLSDGELNEGSSWEAIMAAGHFGLDNLCAIIDYNKIQSFGTVKEVMTLEPMIKKWQSFGWKTKEVNGHDFNQLLSTFREIPFMRGRPNAIIAHTIKGKGVSFMENKLEWHYKSPNYKELKLAIAELS